MQNNFRVPTRPVSISSVMSYNTHRTSSASSSAALQSVAGVSASAAARHCPQQHERPLNLPQSSFSQRHTEVSAPAHRSHQYPLSQHPPHPIRPGTATTAAVANTARQHQQSGPAPQPPSQGADTASVVLAPRCNRCMKPVHGTACYFVLGGCRCMYCNGEKQGLSCFLMVDCCW
jgi:hypothetical protein